MSKWLVFLYLFNKLFTLLYVLCSSEAKIDVFKEVGYVHALTSRPYAGRGLKNHFGGVVSRTQNKVMSCP